MNAQDLARPDNSADVTINLAISGNRLVMLMNALDGFGFETGKYKFGGVGGNDVVCEPHWNELRQVTEAVRDELSKQRMEQRP